MNAVAQGARANRAGIFAENIIAACLDEHHYSFERQAQIGPGIYGTPLRADFLVRGIPGYEAGLIIESKWQDTGGSVDEKFPYLVHNVQECYPYPAIIILHGSGYRPGAEVWLRAQVGGKLAAVFSLEQFMSWLSRRSTVGQAR